MYKYISAICQPVFWHSHSFLNSKFKNKFINLKQFLKGRPPKCIGESQCSQCQFQT